MYNLYRQRVTAKYSSSSTHVLMQAANTHAPSKSIAPVIVVLICTLKFYPKDKKETVPWSLHCKLSPAQSSASWLAASPPACSGRAWLPLASACSYIMPYNLHNTWNFTF